MCCVSCAVPAPPVRVVERPEATEIERFFQYFVYLRSLPLEALSHEYAQQEGAFAQSHSAAAGSGGYGPTVGQRGSFRVAAAGTIEGDGAAQIDRLMTARIGNWQPIGGSNSQFGEFPAFIRDSGFFDSEPSTR